MIARIVCSIILLLMPASAYAQQAAPIVDTVLICAPDLLDAAKPWIEYRTKQGYKLAVVTAQGSAEANVRELRKIAMRSDLKNVVLFGDAAPGRRLGTHVGTHLQKSNVILKWGAEPTFATDNVYADLDEDGSPDVAVGRLCADTPQELSGLIRKIIAYEQNPNCDTWRRRVNFVAGVGGFGMLADKVIETSAKKFITDGIPSSYRTTMTQASWRSPYSPDPRLFREQTIETMNQGCLAWVYLGHGQEQGLDYYRVPDGGLPIFEMQNVANINVRVGSPIAVFLACYTGAFAGEKDCLSEALISKQGGPVAVISGSNVTMPYAMTVMGNAMLHELFIEQRETIGEVVLRAKQELAKPTEDQPKGMIDQLAKVISPNPELLDEERKEHVRLFHLFGDPLMRIRHPKQVEIESPEEATAGETIEVRGTSAVAGNCIIELVCRRDRMTFRPPRRGKFEVNDAWLRKLQETYVKANDTTWTSIQTKLPQGEFTAKLTVPEDAAGLGHVRVYVRGANDFALGASDIYLRAPQVEVAEQPSTEQ